MQRPGVPPEVVEELGSAFRTDDRDLTRDSAVSIAQRLLETTVIPDSIWHPLGFFRMEFGADAAGDRYAFHVWPSESRSTQEPEWLVHRHVWPLKSFVTIGSLVDDQFDEGIERADVTGVRYLAVVVPGRSTLVRTEDELAVATVSTAVLEDAFYEIDLDRFHRTAVSPDTLCITTVRIGPRSKPNSDVLGDRDGPEEVVYERRPVDLDLRMRALSDLTSATN